MRLSLEFPVPRGKEQYAQYMELSRIAVRMQQSGWKVDINRLKEHKDAAEKRQRRMGAIFRELAELTELGKDGQLLSIKEYFWKTLGCPIVSVDRKTKKPKLDAAALLAYATELEDERIVKSAASLYGYRKAGKTIGFCEDYLSSNGRIHPSYNVTGTKGSRWSCSGPNIQQLPAKTTLFDFGDGPETIAASMKDCLIPDDGFILVDADWAALELYLQTYIAGASHLIREIEADRDLHIYNARVMFGEKMIPMDATKKTHKLYRNVSKLAFGFAYNISDHVAQVHKTMKGFIPGITEPMCKRMRKSYFQHHNEFPRWQAKTKESVDEKGFVDTPLLGRRLYLPASSRGYNQALNSQCQITGGDLANLAIIELYKNCRWEEGEQIRAQVHDCFVMQTKPEWRDETAQKLVNAMTTPIDIYGQTTRFVAEPAWGYSWGSMTELKHIRRNA